MKVNIEEFSAFSFVSETPLSPIAIGALKGILKRFGTD